MEGETVWLSQTQMAELFQTTKQNISLHINNAFKEGELEPEATVKEYLTVQNEGDHEVSRRIKFYNLDVIISVGYRVKSLRGTQFRQWALAVLPQKAGRESGKRGGGKQVAQTLSDIRFFADGRDGSVEYLACLCRRRRATGEFSYPEFSNNRCGPNENIRRVVVIINTPAAAGLVSPCGRRWFHAPAHFAAAQVRAGPTGFPLPWRARPACSCSLRWSCAADR